MSARWLSLLIGSLFLGSVACGSSNASAVPSLTVSGPQRITLSVASLTRSYYVLVPPNRKGPLPMVIVLHGYRQSAQELEMGIALDQKAAEAGFVVVYPEGIGNSWNAGSCCGDAQSRNLEDVAFIRQVVDRLVNNSQVDPKRVFVTGISNGGMMAYRLACEASDRIVAVASISGKMALADCHPSRPISVLEMHGTDDSSIPYQGGIDALGNVGPALGTVINDWATRDGCAGEPSITVSGIVKETRWGGCREGTVVELAAVSGAEHTFWWNPVTGQPDVNQFIWDFFSNLPARP